MIELVLSIIFFLSVLLGKYLYNNFVNQISIYSSIWFVMLMLFEAKLLHYDDLSGITWVVIGGAYFSFILGSITYFVARKNFINTEKPIYNHNSQFDISNKTELRIKILVLVTGIIGLFGALQHWAVLFNDYGSFGNILLSSQEIYHLRVKGELKGVLPYFSAFSYVSVFLAGIYSGIKNKFSLYAIIPLLAVILKELANISRAGMLFGILEFVFVVVLFRVFYTKEGEKKNNKLVLVLFLILVVIISAATLVRSVKGSIEHYEHSTRALNTLNENIIVTPSIYLYFSAHVGVLNQYLRSDGEGTSIGENSLMPLYSVLNKFGFVDKPASYQKGYYIPMWVNTGTYLRELHADYGLLGVFLFPYLLGLFLSFLWANLKIKFNLYYFILLVFSFILLSFSFLTMITRLGNFLISLVLLILLVPIIINRDNLVSN